MVHGLIHNTDLVEFCLFVKKHKLNCGAKVCGVDLKEDYVNFKLYIELLTIPSQTIVQEFLDHKIALEFFYWANYWDTTRNSSLAFGLKADNNNVTRRYFHVKLKKTFESILFPEQFFFLKLLRIDVNSLLKGISYEIAKDNTFFKKFYVYIRNPVDIKKVLVYKKMLFDLDIEEIEELELYATNNSVKINIINKLHNFEVKQKVWQTIPNNLKSSLQHWATTLDCKPMYTGMTSSNIVSAYFSFTTKPDNILNI